MQTKSTWNLRDFLATAPLSWTFWMEILILRNSLWLFEFQLIFLTDKNGFLANIRQTIFDTKDWSSHSFNDICLCFFFPPIPEKFPNIMLIQTSGIEMRINRQKRFPGNFPNWIKTHLYKNPRPLNNSLRNKFIYSLYRCTTEKTLHSIFIQF